MDLGWVGVPGLALDLDLDLDIAIYFQSMTRRDFMEYEIWTDGLGCWNWDVGIGMLDLGYICIHTYLFWFGRLTLFCFRSIKVFLGMQLSGRPKTKKGVCLVLLLYIAS